MSDEESTALEVPGERSPGWRGDEHNVQVSAAREAGLDPEQVELDILTEAFKATMTMEDPEDKAIVLRGRTVLKDKQLLRSLRPTLRFLRLAEKQLAIRIHNGAFELRVAGRAAEGAAPTLEAAKVALKTMIGLGLVGLMLSQWNHIAAAIAWGIGLVLAGYTLRTGLVSGRAMLAARLAVSLAMLSQAEKLVLPLAGAGDPVDGPGG